jgi:hypothetical protein
MAGFFHSRRSIVLAIPFAGEQRGSSANLNDHIWTIKELIKRAAEA